MCPSPKVNKRMGDLGFVEGNIGRPVEPEFSLAAGEW